MPAAPRHRATARLHLHGRLVRFVAPRRRTAGFEIAFDGTPALKDPIEAAGVPHKEVGLAIVDGEPVPLRTRLRGGERIEVHPVERQDAGTPPRFVLDVHLGRLAGYLRLLGFDAAWGESDDDALQRIAATERRVLLTRDVGLLKRTDVPAGAFVYATALRGQLAEVLARFGLARLARPWTRCSHCNGPVAAAHADEVVGRVPPRVLECATRFSRCTACGRIYWRGTHEAGLRRRLREAGIDLDAPPVAPSRLPSIPADRV